MNDIVRTKRELKIEYSLNNKIHRENGPAIVNSTGTVSWYKNGIRHREDGPAVIWSDGEMWWYLNGELIHPFKFFAEKKL